MANVGNSVIYATSVATVRIASRSKAMTGQAEGQFWMTPSLSTELSEFEIYLIGSIVSQWGFLEADIFDQTLMSFAEHDPLPKAMKNVQFSEVLQIWRDRVVDQQDDARKKVLIAQYNEIISLNEYRQAIVHSRWEWNPGQTDEITAVRVHKKSVKYVKFTTDDLSSLALRLGQLRYSIRYPGGLEDRATELSQAGGSISRRGWNLLTGRTSLDDLSGK